MRSADLASTFLRWAFARAALARGYWVVTSVYLVVVADLTPFQLVLIGTFQGITVLLTEVPAGVLADTVSRRLSLVLGHVVMGGGMAMAGTVTAFPLLVVSQCLWGLGWALSSGADVAWITDELDEPDRIDRVLAAQARWDLTGNALGVVVFGAMAWALTLSTAIVTAGVTMILLGLFVVARWPEEGFVPSAVERRWRQSMSILRSGVRLVRADRLILVLLAATALVNGALEAFGRLRERRLVTLGMPTQPDLIVWFTLLSLVGVLFGASLLRFVEVRIHNTGVAKRSLVLSCLLGAIGVLMLGHAPNVATGIAGVLVVSGIASPVIRTSTVIWLNRRATSNVRATVHSLLSQAENTGEIIIGLSLAVVAGVGSSATALTAAAALFALTAGLVAVAAND